uniref:Ovule protein n=1 Tax=Strongyloides stercoralis TaxID=6248 RepID=A0A0K0E3Z7_STRER
MMIYERCTQESSLSYLKNESSCSCFILFLIWITPRRIRTTSDKLISIQFKLFSPTSTINGCLEDQLGSKRNSYYLSLISHLTFLNAAREVDRIQNNNAKDQL